MMKDFLNYYRTNESSYKKGDLLERITCYYLQYYASNASDYLSVVLWSNRLAWPPAIKQQLSSLWGVDRTDYRDRGIDIICSRKDGKYDLVQCKGYLSQKSISGRDLKSFFEAVLELHNLKVPIGNLIIVNLSTSGKLKNWQDSNFKRLQEVGLNINQNITSEPFNTIDWNAFEKSQIPDPTPPFKIRGYQKKAIDRTIKHFVKHDKGQLIMASGTGKTFVAYQIIENFCLNSDQQVTQVCFFAPSLTLLNQTASNFIQWKSNQKKLHFLFLGVCSWNKLGTSSNTIPTYSDPAGLSRAVNTSSSGSKKDITVIFATYHSIQVLIDAQNKHDLPIFDLMICDEAHHTAGVQRKSIDTIKSGFYYKVHENETGNFVQTHKRLFLTATPKIYHDSNKKDQEGITVVAMNDESIFGSEIFSYSYKQAVEEGYLSSYKIVVTVFIAEKKSKTIISHKNKSIVVAKELFKITNNNQDDFWDDPDPMRRVLFYTNRVHHSKKLSENFNKYIQEHTQLVEISDTERAKLQSYTIGINYMSGQTKASERATIFQWFEKNEPQTIKIISNVDVLGEGVDVPTLDAVAFFHPRRNKINIAQIAGRVFRKPSKKDQTYTKKRGYIILPVLFYSKQPSLFRTDLQRLDSTEFKNVIDVITSMQEIDESLKVEIANHEFNRIIIRVKKHPPKPTTEEDLGGGGLTKDVIVQLKAKIIERNTKIRRAELKSTLLYQANVIKKTIAQLQQDLEQNPSLKTDYEQLKQLLIDNLNESFKEVPSIQAFLTQHLIMQQVLKTTVPDWAPDVVYEKINRFIKKYCQFNLNLKKILSISPKVIWGGKKTTALVKEVYETIFERFFPEERKTHGIYYTPVAMVDFMLRFVEQALHYHFNSSLTALGNKILDPFAGTGSFLTRLCSDDLNLIPTKNLLQKFSTDLFALELQPLAFYGCQINLQYTLQNRLDNIEYQQINHHILLADTWTMYEQDHQPAFLEKGTKHSDETLNKISIAQFNKAKINIIITNPPYGASSPLGRYRYFKQNLKKDFKSNFKTTNPKAINNLYLMAWFYSAYEVLKSNIPVIICMITPSSWLTGNTLDGVRNFFFEKFTSIYVIDFPNSGQVFANVKIPVAVTMLVFNPADKNNSTATKVYYYLYDGDYQQTASWLVDNNKLLYKNQKWWIGTKQFKLLHIVDPRQNWLLPPTTEDQQKKNQFYLSWPLLSEILKKISLGVKSARNDWVINFSQEKLKRKIKQVSVNFSKLKHDSAQHLTTDYRQLDTAKINQSCQIPIKFWSRDFYKKFKNTSFNFDDQAVYPILVYPFCRKWIYYHNTFIDCPRPMLQQVFTDRHTKKLGMVVAYSENNLHVLAVNLLVNSGFLGNGRVYLINKHQSDFFYYAYAVMQDSCYQQTFLSSLIKTKTLRLPMRQHIVNPDYAFDQLVRIGKKLVQLHVDYEQAPKYQRVLVNNKSLAQFEQELQQKAILEQHAFLQVKKMKLDFNEKAKSITLRFNSEITITHIPWAVNQFLVREDKSALAWIVSQYKEKKLHKNTVFVETENPHDYCRERQHPTYLFDLILKIITVSLKTISIKKSYRLEYQSNHTFILKT